ncbi:MAG: hypothetical protein B5M52_05825 [Helicobacteraceae bacterium 4484_230]|nr:MAG: hypothetical protein B5M52_05825 [Helicobacteraceae bacterium 4484_230]
MSNTILNLSALIESIDKIERYSKEFSSADDFYHDDKSFDAVMMQFIVVGETISRLDDAFKEKHANTPW